MLDTMKLKARPRVQGNFSSACVWPSSRLAATCTCWKGQAFSSERSSQSMAEASPTSQSQLIGPAFVKSCRATQPTSTIVEHASNKSILLLRSRGPPPDLLPLLLLLLLLLLQGLGGPEDPSRLGAPKFTVIVKLLLVPPAV